MTTTRFVCMNDQNEYLTARKATGRMYVARAQWSDFDSARVFQTKGAARNAGKQAGCAAPKVIAVTVTKSED